MILASDDTPVAQTEAVPGRARRISPWTWVLVVAIAWYTWYFTAVTIDVHNGLGTSSYDVGLYDQGLWLASRFKAPFSDLMGRNLLGDHASFILVLVVPLYWIAPGVPTLLFVQTLVIALGAVPLFLIARHLRLGDGLACALALSYLLQPAVGWTNRENYHPDSFIAVLLGMAIYAAISERWRLYVIFVVLTLMVKEDVGLVLIPLGIWVALRRDRRKGLITVLGTIGAAAFGTLVVMRSLIGVPTRNGWRVPFGGVGGFLAAVFTKPLDVLRYFRSEGRPFYLWQMLAPTGLMFACAPEVAAIGALVLFTNVLSTYGYQHEVQYHYSLIAVPALMAGTIYAISRLAPIVQRWAVAVVATSAVVTCLLWGAVPIGRVLTPFADHPIGRPMPASWPGNHPTAEAARELMAIIPDDAAVSAYYPLTPHLTLRDEIYQFPNPFRVVLYGSDDRLERARARLPQADAIEYVMLPTALDEQMQLDWNAVAAEFCEVRRNDAWVLYRRC